MIKTSKPIPHNHFLTILLLLVFWGCEEVKLDPIDIHGSYTIGFHLEASADVFIDIENRYNIVVNTIDLGKLGQGDHDTTWDRLHRDGDALLPGLYYIRLSIDREKYSKTMAVYNLEPTNSW